MIIQIFKNFLPFQNMKEKELSILAGRSMIHKFPTDTVLSRQGEISTEIMFVAKGRVRVILID